jgi:hypothetical protein
MLDLGTILKSLWKDEKYSFFLLLKSLIGLLPHAIIRLGSHILRPLRNTLEKQIATEYKPSVDEYKELQHFGTLANYIFKVENEDELKKEYPGYGFYKIGYYRDCRYVVMKKFDEVTVVCRGSENNQNWIDGLSSELTYKDELGHKVHKGYNAVASGIYEQLVNESIINKDSKIYLTGGSMGHAVSVVLALYLNKHGYDVEKVYGFAGPKVTDYDYGHLPVINVLNLRDPVIYLPLLSLLTRYRHQSDHIVYTRNGWMKYKDSWQADLLLSVWLIDEKLDINEHGYYPKRLKELEDELGKD